MPDITAIRTTDEPGFRYTGRVPVHLNNWHGQTIATLEFILRRDTITVVYGSLEVSVVDRDAFRAWLSHPHQPFAKDDVVFYVRGPRLCLSVNQGPMYPVPDFTITELLEVI
jgi:hypothetical protein